MAGVVLWTASERMEAPGHSCFEGVYPPISRADCTVNCLDMSGLDTLYLQGVQSGVILPDAQVVETGGGRNGVRWPSRTVTVTTRTQIRPNAGSAPDIQIRNWRMANVPDEPVGAQIYVNTSHLLWRRSHLFDGSPRHVMQTVELSHHAESYHTQAIMQGIHGVPISFVSQCRVEIAEMEMSLMNETRKLCTRFAMMWRYPNGDIIPLAQVATYTGPTMCPHSTLGGTPCYAPRPTEGGARAPTGKTPSKRKIGRTSPEVRQGKRVQKGGRPRGGGRGGRVSG